MFQKFGKDIPQSLVDMISGIMYEAKADEPAAPDADAIARRKRLQALRDKQEDDAAERGTGEKKPSPVRQVAGKAYGGAKQKHDDLEEAAGNPGPVRKQVPSTMEKPSKDDMASWHAKQKEKHAYEPKKEELKGNQHKIDANKNGKIDADDFKKLRGEEAEQVDEYVGQPANIPFDADKPKKLNVVIGKKGEGSAKASQLAKMGLKKFIKKETMMGKSGCTSEEVEELDELIRLQKATHTSNPFGAQHKDAENPNDRTRLAKAAKDNRAWNRRGHTAAGSNNDPSRKGAASVKTVHNDVKANRSVDYISKQLARPADKNKSWGKLPEETDVDESRGHKILATKLRQIDTMSSGIAPDYSVNPQSIRDKLKDASNLKNVEIVHQKDTSIKKRDTHEEDMEVKRVLNKLSHGYGIDVHEAVEIYDDLNENHNFGSNVDSHINSLGHGKIGFIMDQQKDSLIAVHHQDGGKHHLSIFHKGNLINQSTHDNFENASGHAHSALTTKKGIKSLNLKEDIQIDELSKPMLATYIRRASDPLHPKSNVNLASRAADKLSKGGEDDGEKDDRKAYNRSRGIGLAAAKMAREEKELQETEVLNQYIKSLGYDPENTDKNKKVMFSKTNAFKTWATQKEGLYDVGQKGTQDIEAGMSPSATARG